MDLTKEEYEQIIKKCNSKADFCRALNLLPKGGNYKIIDSIIKKFNLNTDHFSLEPWNKCRCYRNPQYKLEDLLVENSPITNTYALKLRIIRAGLKEAKCEICGNSEVIELHHINGDSTDNRLENLQILCPNHHALTNNYRIRNAKHIGRRHKVPEELYMSEDEIEQRYQERLANKRVKERKIPVVNEKPCLHCGKMFKPHDKKSSKFCSVECYRNYNKGAKVDIWTLMQDFHQLKSFSAVGKKYNVTDNTIRKWCKFYNLPIHTKEIQEFIKRFNFDINKI